MTSKTMDRTEELDTQELEACGLIRQDVPVMELANEALDEEHWDLFLNIFPHNTPDGKLKAIRWLQGELKDTKHDVYVAEDYITEISKVPEPDWIVDGLVVREGLTLLYADAGVGKTTLMLHMTHCLQSGQDFFMFPTKDHRHHKVLWIEQDESLSLLHSHRDKLGFPEVLNAAKVPIRWDGKRFNEELDIVLFVAQPDVLILDAYTSLGITDITRPESGLVWDELRSKATKYHCAIVVLHHTNNEGGPIGSSQHKAKADSLVKLQKLGEKLKLSQEKVRGTKYTDATIDFDRNKLKLQAVGGLQAALPIRTLVQEAVAAGKTDEDVKTELSGVGSRDTIKRYLREFRGA